jgi:hypothetical protein
MGGVQNRPILNRTPYLRHIPSEELQARFEVRAALIMILVYAEDGRSTFL